MIIPNLMPRGVELPGGTPLAREVRMARYARSLSVLGFILMAWSVCQLVYFYTFVGLRPPWIVNILTMLGFLHLAGALVLLRRLARPAPAGNVVRRLARFWIILSLCSLGLAFWVYWQMDTGPYFFEALVSNLNLNNVLSILRALTGLVFTIGLLPPLWVLSRQPPVTR